MKRVTKESLQKLKGFSNEKVKTIYEELRLKKAGVTLVLYTSGKLSVQGNAEEVQKAAKELEKQGIGKQVKSELFRKESGWIIGTDESLKGDTFGGLVVAGVKADNLLREKLAELGVADSKTLPTRKY